MHIVGNKHRILVLCLFVWNFVIPLQGQEEQWERWVRLLGHPDFTQRERATLYLRSHYGQVADFLKKKLPQINDAEVQWRILQILLLPVEDVAYLLAQKVSSSGGYGYYDSMFQNLQKKKEQVTAGLLAILENPEYLRELANTLPRTPQQQYLVQRMHRDRQLPSKIRYLAVLAVGDLGIAKGRQILRKMWKKQSLLQREVAVSLYKLGDRGPLLNLLKKMEGKLGQSRSRYEKGRYAAELAHLYRAIRNVQKTLYYHEKTAQWIPRAIHYYNLACAYSWAGQKQKALRALQRAIDLGYRDWEWMLIDRDLDSLKTLPSFQKMVQRLRRR